MKQLSQTILSNKYRIKTAIFIAISTDESTTNVFGTKEESPMTAVQRSKRIWRPWYELDELPLCYNCRIPCITKHTHTAEDGKKIQRRYCPKCGRSFKTMYRLEAESSEESKATVEEGSLTTPDFQI